MVSYSQFCYVTLSATYVKMVVNTCGSQVSWLKIVLKVKKYFKLPEKLENGDWATELVKDFKAGTEWLHSWNYYLADLLRTLTDTDDNTTGLSKRMTVFDDIYIVSLAWLDQGRYLFEI